MKVLLALIVLCVVSAAMSECAYPLESEWHAPVGRTLVIDDPCHAPCCTHVFQEGEAAGHPGCVRNDE